MQIGQAGSDEVRGVMEATHSRDRAGAVGEMGSAELRPARRGGDSGQTRGDEPPSKILHLDLLPSLVEQAKRRAERAEDWWVPCVDNPSRRQTMLSLSTRVPEPQLMPGAVFRAERDS